MFTWILASSGPGGRALFREWVQTPIQSGRQVRQEFLARLYFARLEGKETTLRLIEQQRAVFQASIAALSSGRVESKTAAGFHDLVYLYRVKQLENILDWLDLCAERVGAAGSQSFDRLDTS